MKNKLGYYISNVLGSIAIVSFCGAVIYALISSGFKDIGWWILLGIFLNVFFGTLGIWGIWHRTKTISIDNMNI